MGITLLSHLRRTHTSQNLACSPPSSWRRAQARLIDAVLLTPVHFVALLSAVVVWDLANPPAAVDAQGVVSSPPPDGFVPVLAVGMWAVSYALVMAAYSAWLYPRASVGQHLLGLRLIRYDPDHPNGWRLLEAADSTSQARLRAAWRGFLSGLAQHPLWFAPMWMLNVGWCRWRKTGGLWWHDQITGFSLTADDNSDPFFGSR